MANDKDNQERAKMQNPRQNDAKKTALSQHKTEPEKAAFAAWLALPSPEREPPTQRALAKKLGVHETTLSDWKREPDFQREVLSLIQAFVTRHYADVIAAVADKAKSGDIPASRVFLEWVGEQTKSAGAAGAGDSVPIVEFTRWVETTRGVICETLGEDVWLKIMDRVLPSKGYEPWEAVFQSGERVGVPRGGVRKGTIVQ